jgi:glycosyltransferase involved in cell wall biosynthesis
LDRNQGDTEEERREFTKYDEIVYYSTNLRESIQNDEVVNYVLQNNIGTCIIPETCFNRVFEVCLLLRNMNVTCFCIPNAEILRKDEIFLHKNFCGILANNLLCEGIFRKNGFSNVKRIGYSLDVVPIKKIETKKVLKFLFLGGMNAFSRKQCLECIQAFVATSNSQQTSTLSNDMELHMYIQKWSEEERSKATMMSKNDERIFLTFKSLTHEQVDELYRENDVNIMISSQEGLSIPLYEANFKGLPSITLKALPHSEIIVEGINGYLVDCDFTEMKNNPQSFFGQANVCIPKLTEMFSNINRNRNDLQKMFESTYEYAVQRLKPQEFTDNFVDALGLTPL